MPSLTEKLDALSNPHPRLPGTACDLSRSAESPRLDSRTHPGASEALYQRLFAATGQPATVLDLACALHPLAFPWMGLPLTTAYYAYDIVQPRVDFINHFFEVLGMAPLAENRDILVNPPDIEADLGIFFKEAHRFEKRQPGCNREFWASLNVKTLAVSLPTQNLAGTHSLLDLHRQLVEANLAPGKILEELIFDKEVIFLIDHPGRPLMAEINKLRPSLERFSGILSDDDIEQILAIQEQPLPIGIRINPLKANPAEAITVPLSPLRLAGIPPSPSAKTAGSSNPQNKSPGTTIEHKMGQYYLQDAASMVPVSLFDMEIPHPLVLDMAASPGGKTTHLIDRTGDQGFIIANDGSKGRIPALRAVLSNWGGANFTITNYPGESFGSWFPETFDRVLLDAPCSMENLRPTENRPLRETTMDERLRLQERQVQLLISGLNSLKVGGQMGLCHLLVSPGRGRNGGQLSSGAIS